MLDLIKRLARQTYALLGGSARNALDYEHSENPLLRHYIEFRQFVIGRSLKVQSGLAIVVAIALPQFQSSIQASLGQYALILSLLGIPAITVLVNYRLLAFARRGWKKKFPTLDYGGTWGYYGQFSVASVSPQLNDPGRKEANAFLTRVFHGNHEEGETFMEQDVFGLGIREAFGSIGGIKVAWSSYPASFSDREISWAFRAMIMWPASLGLNPDFTGLERYKVIKRDVGGRPILIVGSLTGCVQEKHEFALDGKFVYWRKDSFDSIPDEAKGVFATRHENEGDLHKKLAPPNAGIASGATT